VVPRDIAGPASFLRGTLGYRSEWPNRSIECFMSRRRPWACLSDSPIRLEDRNGGFGRMGQISSAP
jgi:hypothetical protein